MQMRVTPKLAAVIAGLSGIVLAGCAQNPDQIDASYVSPVQYSSYSCDRIQEEMWKVQNRLLAAKSEQYESYSSDRLAVVGAFVFPPAALYAAEPDQKPEIANLKGSYRALDEAAERKGCPLASGTHRVDFLVNTD